jgi:hypothetical protein
MITAAVPTAEPSASRLLAELLLDARPLPDDVARVRAWTTLAVERVFDALQPLRVIPTGSWRHGSGLRNGAPVDLTVALPGAQPATAQHALHTVHEAARMMAPAATVRSAAGAVTMVQPGVRYALVIRPAFDGPDDSYRIPDPAGQDAWVTTSPDAHARRMAEWDASTNGRAVRLARLMKAWRRQHEVPMSSFYLEMAAVRQALTTQDAGAVEDLRTIFTRLDSNRVAAMTDPIDADVRVGALFRLRDADRVHAAVAHAARTTTRAAHLEHAGRCHDAAHAMAAAMGTMPSASSWDT